MTVQEFKEKYPHLAYLEGDDLWDAMTEALLLSDDNWTPLESEGFIETSFKGCNGITFTMRDPKMWIQKSTGKTKTNAELWEPKVPEITTDNYRMIIIDPSDYDTRKSN